VSAPTRVHLVYPHGSSISTPDAIGRELGRRLETAYEVIHHDWSDRDVIRPEPGDVLLGHPHPHPNTVFRRSLRQKGWRRRIMMAPFNHGDLRQVAFEDPIVSSCDLILAITGPYWFRTVNESRCSHWRPKMIHLDLAIDQGDFPPVKTSFAAAGGRRVVYIGHSGSFKNTSHLSEIAALIPDAEFAWMGSGARSISGLTALGQIDFGSQSGKDLVSQFDFLLTVGDADANPTTILEAMAWGLIPICTPTSGYDGIPSIPNVPVDDAAAAAAIVRRLLSVNEPDLLAMQSANWRLLDEHYNWDRFTAQVAEAIESTESPPLGPESLKRRVMFTFYDITSPYGRLGRVASRFRRRFQTLRTLDRTSAERQFQRPSE
jgi:glycosyltransferase involved in cell wall biosynthesis